MEAASSTNVGRSRSGRRLKLTLVGALLFGSLLAVEITEASPSADSSVGRSSISSVDELVEQMFEQLAPFLASPPGEPESGSRRLPLPVADFDPTRPGDEIARPLIVGGEPIPITDAPWQVMLVDLDPQFWQNWSGWQILDFPPQDYLLFCGGSILDATTIITAAHCVDDPFLYEYLHVAAGETYAYGDEEQGLNTNTLIPVAEVIVHPNWNDDTYENDIALLILDRELTLNETTVKPIALPNQDPTLWPPEGNAAWVTGWGTTEFGSREIVNQLRGATVTISAGPGDPNCGSYGGDYDPETMLCAGGPEGGVDACQGDSGGPLAINDAGTWYLAGITSWGNGCGLADYPGVYTRVATYLGWIDEALDAACNPSETPFGGGAGLEDDPYLVCSSTHLTNVGENLEAWFEQRRNIVLDPDAAWIPIGDDENRFTGNYNGGNRSISGLRIDDDLADDLGLFGVTDGAVISGLLLFDIEIDGADRVGALIGHAIDTEVDNVFVFGLESVASDILIAGDADVGGLIGRADESKITTAFAGGVSISGASRLGGLVGNALDSEFGAAFVLESLVEATNDSAGGVIGKLTGASVPIPDVLAVIGIEVEGRNSVGGVVGELLADDGELEIGRMLVLDAVVTGAADGTGAGGLVGSVTVDGDFTFTLGRVAGGAVAGGGAVGGAIGAVTANADGLIQLSQLTGAAEVDGVEDVGGLIGRVSGDVVISDASALGDVMGTDSVGGLVGAVSGTSPAAVDIERTLAAGAVTGGLATGGLIGSSVGEVAVSASFWNTTVNGGMTGVGTAVSDPAGVVGATQAAMQQFSTFDDAGWPIIELSGFAPFVNGYIWGICSGQDYPQLLAFGASCDNTPPRPRPARPEPPALGSGIFTGIEPTRVLDTRPAPAAAGATLRLDLSSLAPAGATGVVLNLTAVDPSATGFLSVVPCDAGPASISNLNVSPGVTVANAVITGLGDGAELCITTSVSTNVLVDVTGWFTGGFVPVPPRRALDTRSVAASVVPAGSVVRVALDTLPSGAVAAAINVAAVDPQASGYLTVYDCGAQPNTSTTNFVAGSNAASQTVTGLSSNREVCIFTSAATQIIVDVFGWLGSIFVAIEPVRLLDTRQTAPVAAQSITRVVVAGQGGIPSGARAIAGTLTAVGPPQSGYATLFPCRSTPPNASTLNFDARATVANGGFVSLDAEGAVCIFSSVAGNYLLDVTGWFDNRSLR